MLFVYRDGGGCETLRKLNSFKDDGVYLRGYCEYSGGVRTFRKDRVVSVIEDDDLGEFAGVGLPEKGVRREAVEDDYRWEICFTGFGKLERQGLVGVARASGMQVRASVTLNLDFLCVGDNAGPKKMRDAEDKGCLIITADQFHEFIHDGVLPESFSTKKKSMTWREVSRDEARGLFAGWAHEIRQAHWPALGIQWREFIDKERTEALRGCWDAENPRYVAMTARRKAASDGEYKGRISEHPEHEAWVKLNTERLGKVYRYPAYGLSDPPSFGFQEGDVFHGAGGQVLQVIDGPEPLEVKLMDGRGNSIGYHLTERRLAEWLRTGEPPAEERRIGKNQSKSAIAQYYEYTK